MSIRFSSQNNWSNGVLVESVITPLLRHPTAALLHLSCRIEPLPNRVIIDNQTVAHHDVALRVGGDVSFVCHHDDGNTAFVEFLKYGHDFDTGPAVEVARRLVGQH